jgi:hypothetical protein
MADETMILQQEDETPPPLDPPLDHMLFEGSERRSPILIFLKLILLARSL